MTNEESSNMEYCRSILASPAFWIGGVICLVVWFAVARWVL